MAQPPAPTSSPETTRYVEPVVRPIVKATDLGSVQVLKQGNLYLLTDPFGDVHPDTRGLGLYEGDTRRLSCSILRVNGERPVLLQASAGGNYHGTIQLTNPRIERNLEDKVRPEDALASQKLGIGRAPAAHRARCSRSVCSVVNYAEEAHDVELELELAADAADIFEVRGWVRDGARPPAAGRAAPGPRHVPLRRPGRHAQGDAPRVQRARRGAGTRGPGRRGRRQRRLGAAPVALGAGARRGARALVDRVDDGAPDAAPPRRNGDDGTVEPFDDAVPGRCRRVDEDTVAASYHAWNRGFAAIRTDNELFNLAIARSAGDLRLLINDGPGPGRAVHRGRRAVVHDAVRAGRADHRRSRRSRSGRSSPSRRSRCSRRTRRRTRTRSATRSRARSSTSCAPARWPAPRETPHRPVLRHRGRDAAVAHPPRRDVGLDRRPRARRPPVAERARGRSSGSTATATATATASWSTSDARTRGLLNQGWKDSSRRDPRPARPARR